MKLYIAEKPSLARALASALPRASGAKEDGCITLANGDVVSWCIGHLLELAEPAHYNAEYKKWRLEHLPIVPQQWHYEGKTQTRKQLNILVKLIKKASSIVHVGDPDREGQLLVDEVLHYAGATKSGKPIQRCLINDLNTKAIAKALTQLKDNRDFAALSSSALARSRADWLYGINMTRLCSLKGQQQGFSGVLSVGRVQTPVLGLVVKRDEEVAKFLTKPFYEVMAHLQSPSGEPFNAKWQPSRACKEYCDEDGRVLSKALAQNVANRITQQNGQVAEVKKQRKKLNAPLPYSLSSLQMDASKRFGMAAKAVLDTCQSLYEKHKLITYPRSDCRYLPEDHHAEAATICRAINHNCQPLQKACGGVNTAQKNAAWNSKKVTAHHAIIPTARQASANALSGDEAKVYELIARQYLAQFYPVHSFDETAITIKILTGDFLAKAKCVVEEGWKVLYPSGAQNNDNAAAGALPNKLPALSKGDIAFCEMGEVIEKQTSPPKPYTDATLIAAMTGINKHVQDASIRKILKDTDGLGTEATRAGILDLLTQRGFIVRKGKNLCSTEAGQALIASLPDEATTPDMTAHWESVLEAICHQQASYQDFMANLERVLPEVMSKVEAERFRGLKSTKAPFKKRRASGSSFKKRSTVKTTGAKTKGATRAPVKASRASAR